MRYIYNIYKPRGIQYNNVINHNTHNDYAVKRFTINITRLDASHDLGRVYANNYCNIIFKSRKSDVSCPNSEVNIHKYTIKVLGDLRHL